MLSSVVLSESTCHYHPSVQISRLCVEDVLGTVSTTLDAEFVVYDATMAFRNCRAF